MILSRHEQFGNDWFDCVNGFFTFLAPDSTSFLYFSTFPPSLHRHLISCRRLGWADDCLFSRWELEGYDQAPRDDIERAIHVTAQLMMPWSFDDAEKTISEYGAFASLHWKRSGYWFIQPRLKRDATPGYDPVAVLRVAEEHKSQIRYN